MVKPAWVVTLATTCTASRPHECRPGWQQHALLPRGIGGVNLVIGVSILVRQQHCDREQLTRQHAAQRGHAPAESHP